MFTAIILAASLLSVTVSELIDYKPSYMSHMLKANRSSKHV